MGFFFWKKKWTNSNLNFPAKNKEEYFPAEKKKEEMSIENFRKKIL